MNPNERPKLSEEERRAVSDLVRYMNTLVYVVFALVGMAFLIVYGFPEFSLQSEEPPDEPEQTLAAVDTAAIENGMHVPTGLIAAKGFNIVAQQCTGCHSARLITQNRANREGWKGIISWMQETQNLWDLGPNEAIILDYLSTHYAPDSTGRRKPLVIEEWYEME